MPLDRFNAADHLLTDPSSLQVLVGKHRLKLPETTQSMHKIAKVYIHAKYSNITDDYDIALLKLTTAITFTREVSPVCLPKKDVWDKKMCVATGWGATTDGRILGCFVYFSRWPDTSISSLKYSVTLLSLLLLITCSTNLLSDSWKSDYGLPVSVCATGSKRRNNLIYQVPQVLVTHLELIPSRSWHT